MEYFTDKHVPGIIFFRDIPDNGYIIMDNGSGGFGSFSRTYSSNRPQAIPLTFEKFIRMINKMPFITEAFFTDKKDIFNEAFKFVLKNA